MRILLLRSLLREMIPDFAGPAPQADEPGRERTARYLIVVARTEPAVYESLRNRHRGDPKVRVVLDRRGASDADAIQGPPPDERRRRRSSILTGATHELVVLGEEVTAKAPITTRQFPIPHEEAPRDMNQTETLEDVQRVTRWLTESQHLLGRVFPSLIEDRERLRRALEAREQECARLGGELSELRRTLGAVQGELDALRGEQTALAEAFGSVVDLLGRLERPLGDIAQRLQIARTVPLASNRD